MSSFLRARLVPRSAPLIDAWRRSRRAPSSRDRSLSSKWWTEAVDRKKPSVGIPVSSAITWSARVGSLIDWPSYSSRTVPFEPANVFSSVPTFRPSSSSSSNSTVMIERASGGASHERSASSSPAVLVTRLVRASSSAFWTVVLPASLGPRMTVRPGASSMSKVR